MSTRNVVSPPAISDSDPQPDKPVEPEAPPPPPEPPRLGSVPGPFKMEFDFEKMLSGIKARSHGSMKYKMDLTKEEAALLEEPPVEMPRLFSK